MEKILINIPAVVSLTVQAIMVLGMFLVATLLDGINITALFAVYIVFWSLQYTRAFRTYLDEVQAERRGS